MHFSKVLPTIFAALQLAISSPPCVDVTHSECVDDDSHIFLETEVPNKEACELICETIGERCHFSLFDRDSFLRGNCRLYDSSFHRFILECNELSGPKYLRDDCYLENPEDNTCQIYREGKCVFGIVEESEDISSWESCNSLCRSISQCQLWRYQKEERSCKIMYSGESSCKWQFSPREPSFDECDDLTTPTTITIPTTTTSTTSSRAPFTTTARPSTTTTPTTISTITPITISTTTPTHQSCDIPKPPNHGDWFCPPSSDLFTCHLECDPGYVSNNKTVITCNDGEWSSAPSCETAVALITGSWYNPSNLNFPISTVEIYSEQLHKKLPDLPLTSYYHTLDIVNSLVLLCGGQYLRTSCLTLTSSQEWTHHSDTVMSRSEHSSVSMLGKLHLLGGDDWNGAVDSPYTTECLAPPSDQWHQSWDLQDSTRRSCSSKMGPEILITTGGRDYPSSVVSYNATNGAATRLQDLTTRRYNHGCVYLKEPATGSGRVLVAGGYNDEYLSSSEMYDTATGEWTDMGELTSSRDGVRMVLLGDNVLAMGGHYWHPFQDTIFFSSVDRFNWTTMQWTATENMLEGRSLHAVTGVPPSVVGIGHK